MPVWLLLDVIVSQWLAELSQPSPPGGKRPCRKLQAFENE
jgi:hypothetical protein